MEEKLIEYNDGKGLYDKYGLIDACINDLCGLRITIKDIGPVGNPVVDVVNRLIALRKGLKEEEKNANGQTDTK